MSPVRSGGQPYSRRDLVSKHLCRWSALVDQALKNDCSLHSIISVAGCSRTSFPIGGDWSLYRLFSSKHLSPNEIEVDRRSTLTQPLRRMFSVPGDGSDVS